MSRPLVHVYLNASRTKAAEGQPLNAGISGAAALRELEKANGPGNLKDPTGVVVTSDEQNLPEGEYLFIPAGEADLHNAASESLVLVHHLQWLKVWHSAKAAFAMNPPSQQGSLQRDVHLRASSIAKMPGLLTYACVTHG